MLIFEVDGQRHGVPAHEVQELLPALAIMPVPGAAPFIEGVIDLHGAVVPVLDVRQQFGLPAKGLALSDHFIVVRRKNRLTALHVDRALELARVSTMGEPSRVGGRVVKVGDGMVLLHSTDDLIPASGEEAAP